MRQESLERLDAYLKRRGPNPPSPLDCDPTALALSLRRLASTLSNSRTCLYRTYRRRRSTWPYRQLATQIRQIPRMRRLPALTPPPLLFLLFVDLLLPFMTSTLHSEMYVWTTFSVSDVPLTRHSDLHRASHAKALTLSPPPLAPPLHVDLLSPSPTPAPGSNVYMGMPSFALDELTSRYANPHGTSHPKITKTQINCSHLA
ncbi:hypothetical protein BC629DRAFT_479880 [Irpex lacteus]|nr:hypothetical protein BC629DRAFT_479880 [Irpex lacteus]